MKLLTYLHKQSQTRLIAIGVVLTLLIGTIDYITGFEISFSLFYLIPISMIAWFISDRRMGVLAAITGAVIWLTADLSGGRVYSSDVIPFWNAGVRLSFFLIVAVMLASLREANAHREELTHFVVHDLRSPISNTLSGLQLLIDLYDDTLDTDQRQIVSLGMASCNRMLTLVNSILDLAKLEDGKMQLDMQPTATQGLLDVALQQVSALAVRSEVTVQSDIEAGAEHIHVDGDLTTRVLVNLISNALKYSPEGRTVTVRAVPQSGNADMVAIHVVDQGAGIPKEWADKVFDKFAQVGVRKQGLAVGSGLGLTFCRLAVEAQGGRIGLTSEVGRGTTVTMTVPRR